MRTSQNDRCNSCYYCSSISLSLENVGDPPILRVSPPHLTLAKQRHSRVSVIQSWLERTTLIHCKFYTRLPGWVWLRTTMKGTHQHDPWGHQHDPWVHQHDTWVHQHDPWIPSTRPLGPINTTLGIHQHDPLPYQHDPCDPPTRNLGSINTTIGAHQHDPGNQFALICLRFCGCFFPLLGLWPIAQHSRSRLLRHAGSNIEPILPDSGHHTSNFVVSF